MLDPHYPSSPTRPPVEHLSFRIKDPEATTIRFFTHAFGAFYAAQYWLDTILDNYPQHKWQDSNTIHIEHNDHLLIIKGSHLEDVLEYKPTKEEKAWEPPEPDINYLNSLMSLGKIPKIPEASIPQKTPPNKKPSIQTSRHKTQKQPDKGYITVAQIAAELNIAPNKARNLLRKAKIQKPKAGWTFKTKDPAVKEIREILKKV